MVRNLAGLTIDHFVEVDLIGFYRISNAIGPITVNLANGNVEKMTQAYEMAQQFAAMTGLAFPEGVSATTRGAFEREELADANAGPSETERTPDRERDRDRRQCGLPVEWLQTGMLRIHRESHLAGPEVP